MSGFKKKATSLGVDYISAEVVGINVNNDSVKSVKVLYRYTLFHIIAQGCYVVIVGIMHLMARLFFRFKVQVHQK